MTQTRDLTRYAAYVDRPSSHQCSDDIGDTSLADLIDWCELHYDGDPDGAHAEEILNSVLTEDTVQDCATQTRYHGYTSFGGYVIGYAEQVTP